MKLKQLIFAFIALGTVIGNFGIITGAFSEAYSRLTSDSKSRDEYISGPRELVADNLGSDSLCFISSGDVREKSAETAVIQAVNWQIMPSLLTVLESEYVSDISWSGGIALLTPSYDSEISATLSTPEGRFNKVGERGGRTLWKQKDGRTGAVSRPEESPVRELPGLLAVAAVMISGALAGGFAGILLASISFSLLVVTGAAVNLPAWYSFFAALLSGAAPWFARRFYRRGKINIGATAAALCIFAVFAVLALAHTFTTPYGLAISGGRAKLWYLLSGKAGGFISSGFFTNPVCKTLEPAYPPGCTAITLGSYAISGFCGEWLTQLIGCAFLAVTACFLIVKCEGLASKLWAIALFFVPAALTVGGQFYPEPLMALCVLVGWDRIRNGDSGWPSWFLIGAAGWFKNEGLVFAVAAWAAWRIIGGKTFAGFLPFATGLVLPLAWHVFCRAFGGGLNDYAPVWQLSFARCAYAAGEILREAFAAPWRHGFAFPAAVILAAYIKRKDGKCPRSLLAALLFTAISTIIFAGIYGCSTADPAWHINTSLTRLLWTPALVLVYEAVAEFRSHA